MNFLHCRTIAEHFSRLSSLLESEALRCGALGLTSSEKLYRDAMELRQLAEALWQQDEKIVLPDLLRLGQQQAAAARVRRESISGAAVHCEADAAHVASGAPIMRSA